MFEDFDWEDIEDWDDLDDDERRALRAAARSNPEIGAEIGRRQAEWHKRRVLRYLEKAGEGGLGEALVTQLEGMSGEEFIFKFDSTLSATLSSVQVIVQNSISRFAEGQVGPGPPALPACWTNGRRRRTVGVARRVIVARPVRSPRSLPQMRRPGWNAVRFCAPDSPEQASRLFPATPLAATVTPRALAPIFDPRSSADGIVKLSSNENPLGISPAARDAIVNGLDEANRYPGNTGDAVYGALSEFLDLSRDHLFLGAGSTEILRVSVQAWAGPGARLIYAQPTFEDVPGYAAPVPLRACDRAAHVELRARHRSNARGGGEEQRADHRLHLQPEQPDGGRHAGRSDRVVDEGSRGADPVPGGRGLHRVRRLPGLPDRDSVREGHAERDRRAHVLEDLRHGRHSARLRSGSSFDGPSDPALRDPQQPQSPRRGPRRWRRSPTPSWSGGAWRSTPRLGVS